MQPINIQDYNWKVEAGVMRMIFQYNYPNFEQLAAQHIYATNATDGEYSGEKFGEPYYRYDVGIDDVKLWDEVVPNTESAARVLISAGWDVQLFLPLKDQPQPVKEVETVDSDLMSLEDAVSFELAGKYDKYEYQTTCETCFTDGANFGAVWCTNNVDNLQATLDQRDAEIERMREILLLVNTLIKEHSGILDEYQHSDYTNINLLKDALSRIQT